MFSASNLIETENEFIIPLVKSPIAQRQNTYAYKGVFQILFVTL